MKTPARRKENGTMKKDDANMKFEKYRKMLSAKEQELLADLKRAGESGREQPEMGLGDAGDDSVISEVKESLFGQVDRDKRLLGEVQQALQRIKDGAYGRCLDDGEMIDAARLEAVPWTSYCLKHQQIHSEGEQDKVVTL